jgi:hypothetical protein
MTSKTHFVEVNISDEQYAQVQTLARTWHVSIDDALDRMLREVIRFDYVQTQNPKTHHWVVIDKALGTIVKTSTTTKPYKNIRIATRRLKV